MKNEPLIYHLSKLIEYPNSKTSESLAIINNHLTSKHDLFAVFGPFADWFLKLELQKAQEIYTSTFDLQGAYCLDLGYVLFGEDYKRGAFLVEIKKLQSKYLPEQGPELADHLPYVMRLLNRLEDNLAKELIEKIILPSLERLLQGTDNFEGVSMYARVLYVIKKIFENEFVIDRLVLKEALC